MAFLHFLLLAAAVGAGAFIVTVAEISRSIHVWVDRRKAEQLQPWTWLQKLLNCPFCVSVWLSFIATLIWRPAVLPYFWPFGFVATSLAMAGLAMLVVVGIKRAVRPV